MWTESDLAYWGAALVAHSPTLMVELAILYCCMARMHRHPRECKLVMAVIFLSWFGDCILSPVTHQVLLYLNNEGIVVYSKPLWMIAFIFPSSLIGATVWGLLLFAVFGKSRSRMSRYLVEDTAETERRQPDVR